LFSYFKYIIVAAITTLISYLIAYILFVRINIATKSEKINIRTLHFVSIIIISLFSVGIGWLTDIIIIGNNLLFLLVKMGIVSFLFVIMVFVAKVFTEDDKRFLVDKI